MGCTCYMGMLKAVMQLACMCSAIVHRGANLGPTCLPAGKHGHGLHLFLYAQLLTWGALVPDVQSLKSLCGSRVGTNPTDRPEVGFLDLAWGGSHGKVTYPPFVNGKVVCTVKDPDGQPIFRDHDTQQLRETMRRYRREYKQPDAAALHHACYASKRQVHCRATPTACSLGSQDCTLQVKRGFYPCLVSALSRHYHGTSMACCKTRVGRWYKHGGALVNLLPR